MLSDGQKKRLSRIARRATPEVQKAFAAGKISARRADQLLYLEPQEQLAELQRLLAVRDEAARRSRIVTSIIKAHVAAGRRDLVALDKELRTALSSATIKSHA
jgi:hypothetical protein